MKKKKETIYESIKKPYNENEYVKLGTYNFKIVKDHMYFGLFLKIKMN